MNKNKIMMYNLEVDTKSSQTLTLSRIQNIWTRHRVKLMALTAIITVLFISIIILGTALSNKNQDNGCLGNLKCLPIGKCRQHINPDFTYGCGDHEQPKICCMSSDYNNQTDEVITTTATTMSLARSRSRLEKLKLLPLPKQCGKIGIPDKIFNGKNATIGQFPWMALLRYNYHNIPLYRCGGTIINKRYILTAAHCIMSEYTLTHVRLGELNLLKERDCDYDGEEEIDCADAPKDIKVEKIIAHSQYNKTNIKNDIALLRLAEDVNFTDFIFPICLPFGLKLDVNYFSKTNFTISGWGKTTEREAGVHSLLQYAHVHNWPKTVCSSTLPPEFLPITDNQICASGSETSGMEACSGDSGGPLSDNYAHKIDNRTDILATQIGIVSFKRDTCGPQLVPTVYTRIDKYLDWILDNIEP